MDLVVLCQHAPILLVLEPQVFLVGIFYVFQFQVFLLVFPLDMRWWTRHSICSLGLPFS